MLGLVQNRCQAITIGDWVRGKLAVLVQFLLSWVEVFVAAGLDHDDVCRYLDMYQNQIDRKSAYQVKAVVATKSYI